MNSPRTFGLAAVAAIALSAFATTSASATTFEIGGTAKNEAVTFSASLKSGGTTKVTNTSEAFHNTCTASTITGTTSVFTGTRVTGALSTFTLDQCLVGKVTVHLKGQLYVEHEAGTTAGLVYSENAELTVPSIAGYTLTCKTGTGTLIGTMGEGTLKVAAQINCGFFLPSALWLGTYTVTTAGLGVTA
jgi:hypothetical protein